MNKVLAAFRAVTLSLGLLVGSWGLSGEALGQAFPYDVCTGAGLGQGGIADPQCGGSGQVQFKPGFQLSTDATLGIRLPGTSSGAAVITAPASLSGTQTFTLPATGGSIFVSGSTSLIGANLVQNGDFAFDRRNNGNAVTITTGGGFLLAPDRWGGNFVVSTSGAGNPTLAGFTAVSAPTTCAIPSTKELKWTMNATPSTTVPAALILQTIHKVEGRDMAFLGFGGAGGTSVTVQVCLKSSLSAQTYGVALQNSAQARSFVHNCVVTSAATWTACTFTAPADTTGTWNNTPGTVGMFLVITPACGSTFQTTADAWQAGNFTCTSAQTQLTSVGAATLEIASVKIEAGVTATPFVAASSTGDELAMLKRYFDTSFPIGTTPAQSAGLSGAQCVGNPIAAGQPSLFVPFPVQMFSNPTVTTFNPSAANANWRDVTGAADVAMTANPAGSSIQSGILLQAGATVATIAHVLCIHYTADAGL